MKNENRAVCPREHLTVLPAIVWLALGLGPYGAATAANLSPAEARVVAAAAAQDAYALQLTERLVDVNSGTMNFAGVEQVGQMMRAELEPLGISVRWVPMGAAHRAGHLIAEHKGTGGGKRMLLIGHLDTVFEKDSPFQTMVRRGELIEGPGVCDMKGGLAIMIGALRAMKTAGTLAPARILIVLSGDEEWPGTPQSISRADLLQAADHADLALEFEALAREDGHDMGSIARRSASDWTITVKAKSGHSSQVFSEGAGYGAAYELARILDAFRREVREDNATFNVGLGLTGAAAELTPDESGGSATGKSNVIAAEAFAHGDLRTLSNDQTERIRQKMQSIVAQHLAGTEGQITFEEGYPAMAPTAGSRALLKQLNNVNRDLGLEAMGELDPMKRGAGDIAFVAPKLDGLIGMGAAGSGAHAPGETADPKSFDRQIKRAALLMTRLSHSGA
jgi:glutamate carboxypeptidase